MSYRLIIISFLAAIALSPLTGLAQSSSVVTNNFTVRGLQNFQLNGSRPTSSSVARFNRYSSGITFSAPPRTSTNPLAGRSGLRMPRSRPAKDLRLSASRMNYRPVSMRLSGNMFSPMNVTNQATSRNLQRLAYTKPIVPIRQVRSNSYLFTGSSRQSYAPGRDRSSTIHRAGSSLGTGKNSLPSRSSARQSANRAKRNARSAILTRSSQRGKQRSSRASGVRETRR